MPADTLTRLGLRPDDERDAQAVAAAVAGNGDLPRVARLAERLRPGIGDLEGASDLDPWADPDAGPEPYGPGVLPLLALAETAPDVVSWHAGRGVPEAVSWASLADLGHQAMVHRMTYGSFGLHAHGWLRLVWSGAFLWLGRLQFNLQRDPLDPEAGWVISTHIPPTGPLSEADVDAAFAAATEFFPRHFPDYPADRFHCASWLLDPQLAAAVPGSNIARFGARWSLAGAPGPGDADALFFTFRRRGEVVLDRLPSRTTLERAIVQRLRAGQHWEVRHGFIPVRRGS